MNFWERNWIRFIKCFIVPCQEATYLETKRQFEKLTLRERINLKMHMMKCSYCRVFRTEQEFISKCLTKFKDDIEKDKLYYVLPGDAKNKLEKIISTGEK